MRRAIFIFLGLFFISISLVSFASSTIITLQVPNSENLKDTSLNEFTPEGNNGTNSVAYVSQSRGSIPYTYSNESLLINFNLSKIIWENYAGVKTATLYLYSNSRSAGTAAGFTIDIYEVNDTSWAENTVTYNNFLGVAGKNYTYLDTHTGRNIDEYYSWVVTNSISNGKRNISYYLNTSYTPITANSGIRFYTKEVGNYPQWQPKLVIEMNDLFNIVSPTSGQLIENSNINFTLNNLTAMNYCWYTLNKGLSNISMSLIGSTYYNYTSLTDSRYNVTFYCNRSTNGLISGSGPYNFTINSLYPQISYGLYTGDDGANKSQSHIFINASWTEANFANITFRANNNIYSSNNQIYSWNFTGLTNGIYFYNITICDLSNWCNTTVNRRITLDNTAPSATLTGPANNSINSSDLINFTASISDNLGIKNATLNIYNQTSMVNQTTITYAPNTITSTIGIVVNLIDNIYTWSYNLFDWAGNSYSTANNTVYKDSGNLSYCHTIDQSGSYYLSQNIVGTGDCFNISAPNVIFDCNSFSIKGPGGATFFKGIYSNSFNNIIIKNCDMNQWAYPIYLENSNYHQVYNINISGTSDSYFEGITLSNSSNSILNNLTIKNNIATNAYSVYLVNANNISLTNSTLMNNQATNVGYAIYMDQVNNSFFRNNIFNETFYTLGLSKSNNNTFRDSFLKSIDVLGRSNSNTFLNTSDNVYYFNGNNGNESLIKKWYVNLNSTDNANNALQTTFKIYDKLGSLLINEQTPLTGILPTKILTESIINESGNFYSTPHIVNVSAVGYISSNSYLNISQSTNTDKSFMLGPSDLTGPQVTIIYPVFANYSNIVSINFTATDTNIGTCWFSNNSGIINVTIPCNNNYSRIAIDGWNTWTIYANDTAGNKNSSTIIFFVDRTNPYAVLNSPANNTLTNNPSVTFEYQVSDNLLVNYSIFRLFNQSGEYYNFTMPIEDTILLVQIPITIVDGIYRWFAQVFDIVGNYYSTGNYSLTIDTIPNGITITSPTSNGIYNTQPNLVFSLTGDDYVECKYSLNGAANQSISCTGTPLLTAIEGNNTLTLYVTDAANNINSSTVTFFYNYIGLYSCGTLSRANTLYKLERDIITTSTCFTISGNNITLDGNGHSITSNGAWGTKGVSSNSYDDLKILNFKEIQNFYYGIYLQSNNNNQVSNNSISQSSMDCIMLFQSNNNILDNINCHDGAWGIEIFAGFSAGVADNNYIIDLEGNTNQHSLLYVNDGGFPAIVGTKLLYNNSFGSILFNPVDDITSDLNFTNSGNIHIKDNFVNVNSSISGLNISANITLNGIGERGWVRPIILKNGLACTDCYNFTSLTASTIVFNVSSWSNYSIGEDERHPRLTLSSPAHNYGYANSNISINYTVIDENLDSCWYSLQGINYTLANCLNSSLNLSDGSYAFIIYSNDTQNHVNSTGANFYISTGIPTINLDYPTDGLYKNTQATVFNFTANPAQTLDTCQLFLNGTINQSLTGMTSAQTINFTSINLAEGQYIWNVKCNDSLNNVAFHQNNHTLFIDLTNPNATLNSPANNTKSNSGQIVFSYNVSDNYAFKNSTLHIWNTTGEYRTSFNNIITDTISPSIALIDGLYKWFVSLFDQAGNEFITDNRTLTIDTVKPNIFLVNPANTNYTSNIVSLNYSATDTNLQSCYYSATGYVEVYNRLNLLGISSDRNISLNEVYFNGLNYYQAKTAGTIISINKTSESWQQLPEAINLEKGASYYVYTNQSGNLSLPGAYRNSSAYPLENLYFYNGSQSLNYTDAANNIWIQDSVYTYGFDEISQAFGNIRVDNLTQWKGYIIYSFLDNLSMSRSDGRYIDTINTGWNAFVLNHDNIITTCMNITFTGVQGSNQLTIYANDTFGNVNNQSVSFYIDSLRPSVTINLPLNNTKFNYTGISFNYNISDNLGIKNSTLHIWNSTAEIDNSTSTFGLNIFSELLSPSIGLVDGIYRWFVSLFDNLGNFGISENRTLMVDTTVPAINFVTLSGTYNYLPISLNYTLIEANRDSCWYKNIYNEIVPLVCGENITGMTLGQGMNNFIVYANDTLNHISSDTINLNIDNVKPILNINSPQNQTHSNANIGLSITSSEIVSSYWYNLGAQNISFNNGDTIHFPAGSNNIVIYANDTAGNVGNSSVMFYITYTNLLNIALNKSLNTVQIGSNLNLTANVATDNTQVSYCDFSLTSPTRIIYNDLIGTSSGLNYVNWTSINKVINESGTYNYNVTCMNQFNTVSSVNSTFLVNAYNLTILEPLNPLSFSAIYAKTELKTVNFKVFDNVNTLINQTIDFAIINQSNFTISYPNSVLLNSTDSSINPANFYFTIQAKSDTPEGLYSGNVTLTNQFTGEKSVVYFNYGANPPAAVPQLFNSDGSYECVGTPGGTCALLIDLKQEVSDPHTFHMRKIGSYASANNCTFKFTGNLNQPWITTNPTFFDLAGTEAGNSIANSFILNLNPTSSTPVGDYSGNILIHCNQTDATGYSSDSINSIRVDIHVSAKTTHVDEGGTGGGGDNIPLNLTNITLEITKGICGNKVCEPSYNENYNSCPVDCPGNLTPITDCLNGGENCFLKSTTALIWIGGFLLLILLLTSVLQVKKKNGSQRVAFLPTVQLSKPKKKSYYK